MTAAQKREVRKEARLNKRLGKRAYASPPPRAVVPYQSKQLGNKSPQQRRAEEEEARKSASEKAQTPDQEKLRLEGEVPKGDADFEDLFLSIVNSLPPGEQREQAFSYFAVFRKLPKEDQKNLVDQLMAHVETVYGPLRTRVMENLRQDFEYESKKLNLARNFAEAQFDQLVHDTDFNLLRSNAKTDKALAKTLQRVSSNAFLGNIVGSGIVRRQGFYVREAAQELKEDAAIQANQLKNKERLSFADVVARTENELARQQVLRERGEFAKSQEILENSNVLFAELFQNRFTDVGDTARRSIPTGAIEGGASGYGSTGIVEQNRLRRLNEALAGGDDARRQRAADELREQSISGFAKAEDRLITLLQGRGFSDDAAKSEYAKETAASVRSGLQKYGNVLLENPVFQDVLGKDYERSLQMLEAGDTSGIQTRGDLSDLNRRIGKFKRPDVVSMPSSYDENYAPSVSTAFRSTPSPTRTKYNVDYMRPPKAPRPAKTGKTLRRGSTLYSL
jgi:hypothetical protein